MARPRVPAVAPAIPSNALVASSTRYPKKVARIYQGDSRSWQEECYRHYAICGEARFAATFFGHALSRAVLYVDKPGNGEAKVDSGPAYDQFQALFNGRAGQAQMLKEVGTHLTIAGECFLIGRSVDESDHPHAGEEEIWEIVSPLEITVTGNRWSIQQGDKRIDLSDDDVVIRIWTPRPGKRMEADSPFRSLLPILSEIEWLTRHVFAQVSSRLAGSGILLLPEGMSFPPPADKDGKAQEFANEADGFMMSLADAMMTPISDPSSPSAIVPLIVTAPGEEIDKAKLLTFWSELDANALELRNEAIRRFATGMDLPAEQILGMSSNNGTGGGTSNGVSHWGAWQIEEATIKMHVEPMLEVICNALTVSWLRPLLDVSTDEFITYDSAALRLRPDRSKEAMELYDRGLLKAEVMMRETGFDPVSDMMDDEEFRRWLLRKVASGSSTPEQVGAALTALGVDLKVESDSENPRKTPEAPSLEDHPSRPRTPAESSMYGELLTACDTMVLRALEKAGNRYLNAGVRGKNRDRSIDPTEFHLSASVNGEGPGLLEGAFPYAPRVLAHTGYDAGKVEETLKAYCLALFETQTPHTRESLTEYLGRVL